MEIELCWNITTRCNQNCKYCHRFLNLDELNKSQNMKVLDNIIRAKINKITWTGGEVLLVKGLGELINNAYYNGVQNKLITNGLLLNNKTYDLINKLDKLVLSLDSIDDEINLKLGRGGGHAKNIIKLLDSFKNKRIKIGINTVVSRLNFKNVLEMNTLLSKYDNVIEWRLFKFMPLRNVAVQNKDIFEISEGEFDNTIRQIKDISKKIIVTRKQKEMENLYLLIVANGDVFVTKDNKDIKIGSALNDEIFDLLKNIKE